MATIEIPTHAAASMGSGFLVPHPTDGSNGFADMHKATEEMAGRPVWTHEFAHQGLADKLKEHVVSEQPWTGDIGPQEGEGREPWERLSRRLHAEHGPTVTVRTFAARLGPESFSEPLKLVGSATDEETSEVPKR